MNFTAEERVALIREATAAGLEVGATRSVLEAMIEAADAWFEDNRQSLNQALNAATSPVVVPGPVKRAVVIGFLIAKAAKE